MQTLEGVQTLSLAAARRTALAAQGFAAPRPTGRDMGLRDVQRQIDRLGQFQIDSINVVARAHFMPLFSRLGAYSPELLERAAHQPPRRMFEYWGHAASLIDVNLQPALRWKMADAERTAWRRVVQLRDEQPHLLEEVLRVVAEQGPLTAREVDGVLGRDEQRDRSHWGWNWSGVKTALEWHFSTGQVTSARRNAQFERVYDLPDRVLPRAVVEAPTPDEDAARVQLARRAARALGVMSERCVADYFRTSVAGTRRAIAELEAAGELVPVQVEGWPGRRWLWHEARTPRRITGRALVSPFDSLMFERERAHRLFDLFYRIEIYVPEAQRQHGYYVYPFLLDGEFVARVDLKADRRAGVLRAQATWLEPGRATGPERVAGELAAELRDMAGWLDLDGVQVAPRGDLADTLRRAVDAGSASDR